MSAAVSLLPDWDEDQFCGPTRYDVSPFALEDWSESTPVVAVVSSDSHVRMRPQPPASDGSRFIDGLGEDLLNIHVALVCLEHSSGEQPYDRSARAAFDSLKARTEQISELYQALNEIYLDAADPHLHSLFGTDAPLSAYAKGLVLFTSEAILALTDLARSLRVLQPDWFSLRRRLEEASHWYFDGLPREIREDALSVVPPDHPLHDHLEELFWAAAQLDRGLEQRFG
jgi:hypothetical protein